MKATQRKPKTKDADSLTTRLKELRRAAGLSQEAIGAQGFVSTPGWIKVENGQRSPSEKLLAAFVGFLVSEKSVRAGARSLLVEELTALKFTESKSPFLAGLAREHLAGMKAKSPTS